MGPIPNGAVRGLFDASSNHFIGLHPITETDECVGALSLPRRVSESLTNFLSEDSLREPISQGGGAVLRAVITQRCKGSDHKSDLHK